MKQWYVIQTKPRQESVAQLNLERQGFECYLPLIKSWRKHRGKKVLVDSAMFANYVLIHIDLLLSNCAPIRSTRGVTAMVRFGNQILPVPDQVVATIKQYSQQSSLHTQSCQYRPGQQVHIDAGPFAGLSAIFLEQSGTERAILLLEMLGKQQRINMPLAAIE